MRQPVGKRLRFEVFKRDHFACQYCGAQPPDVVLVVDHIDPVAAGGQSTIDNLITACEACNQGKSDKPLTTRQVRPDADLLYLETQQEIAELRRYQEAREELDEVTAEVAEYIWSLWYQITQRRWGPDKTEVESLVRRYGPEVTEDAIRATAMRVRDGRLRYLDNVLAYLHGVARNMTEG